MKKSPVSRDEGFCMMRGESAGLGQIDFLRAGWAYPAFVARRGADAQPRFAAVCDGPFKDGDLHARRQHFHEIGFHVVRHAHL